MKYQYSILTLRPSCNTAEHSYFTVKFTRPRPPRIIRVWFNNGRYYRKLSSKDYDYLAELLRISPDLIYENAITGIAVGGDGKRYGSCLTISDTGD